MRFCNSSIIYFVIVLVLPMYGYLGAGPNFFRRALAKVQSQGYRCAQDNVWSVARSNDIQGMKLLLDANPSHLNALSESNNPSLLKNWGLTPLIIAVRSGQTEMVRYLLDSGANPNLVSFDELGQTTPLVEAIRKNNHELAELLIEYGANIDLLFSLFNKNALTEAVDSRNSAILRLLLDKGADANARGCCDKIPLHEATCSGDEELVRLLVQGGADVNQLDTLQYSAVFWASWLGHAAVLRLLLENGASILNGQVTRSFFDAAFHGDVEILTTLITKGLGPADLFDGRTLLAIAAGFGQSEAVDQLLAKNARIDDRSPRSGQTALHAAVGFRSCIEIVRTLLAQGADIGATDLHGQTPLHIAAEWGQVAAINVLVECGADVHAKDANGRTPLHAAGYYGVRHTPSFRGFLSSRFGGMAYTLVAKGAGLPRDLAGQLQARRRDLYMVLEELRRNRLGALGGVFRQAGICRNVDTLIMQMMGQPDNHIRRLHHLIG